MSFRLESYNRSVFYRARVVEGPTVLDARANRHYRVEHVQIEEYAEQGMVPVRSVVLSGAIVRKDGTLTRLRHSQTFYPDQQHEEFVPEWMDVMVDQVMTHLRWKDPA